VSQAFNLAHLRKAPIPGDPYQVKAIYYYFIPPGMRPTFIVDVREHFEDWIRALEAHKTQFSNPDKPKHKSHHWSVLDLVRAESSVRGYQMGVQAAQVFLSVAPLRVHDPLDLVRGVETRP